MRRLLLLIPLLLAAFGIFAARAQPRTLTVYAAASLTEAFTDLKPLFERENPGARVRLSFGASSQLQAQLRQGAPVDVFASADYAQMRPLAAAGLVSPPQTFARNRLAVVLPAVNPGRVRGLADLGRPGLRVVATAESVPIGRYTQEVLRKLGGDFARRVNANVVSRETNVRAVLAKVELGEADAAFVYESDAAGSRRVKRIPIPERVNVAAEYPIAVVGATPNRALAEAWVRLVLSPRGQSVLKRRGFR